LASTIKFVHHSLTRALLLQSFLRSAILYCYFRKVSASDSGEEELKRKLEVAEEENARLKAVVAKHEDDL
jgi:hypothetical protein